ncbi:MAG: histone deacetylase family protein [Hyphomicrobiales bacterium]|nr:histone deacetylase family protein [Hyphomicrobiales bacterium]
MTTLYLTHPICLEHESPPGHPERPDRLRAVWRALDEPRFGALHRREARAADPALALLAHDERYCEILATLIPPEGRIAHVDADTYLSAHSWPAILHAMGGAVQAVEAVMRGEAGNAFSATRPPGHHAERARAMGFCLFNHVAVATRYAQREHGAERVAIVDFDVHHGNGTQEIFWSDASVLYASSHQWPLYPGTGAASEMGEHDNIVNLPLASGTGPQVFRAAFESVILPRVDAFHPDLIVVSAGFDAHRRDPLASLDLGQEEFGWVTRRLMEIAGRRCGGRIVSVLEGGYDLAGLSASVAAHVEALMEA